MTTTQSEGKSFRQMNFGEKLVFLLKVIVFVATFGYAFPRVLVD